MVSSGTFAIAILYTIDTIKNFDKAASINGSGCKLTFMSCYRAMPFTFMY